MTPIFTYARVMAALFWAFMMVTILGMLMRAMSVGDAVALLGVGGLVFVSGMFILWLRNGPEEERDRRRKLP